MEHFTPFASLMGGALIGLSAALLLVMNGKIAGISGIAGGLLAPAPRGDRAWRWAFLAGLVLAGVIAAWAAPAALAVTIDRSTTVLIVAGLLVGVGTRIGSGCTSGHGVCGIGRFSGRSILATITFLVTGAVTVFLYQQFSGGPS